MGLLSALGRRGLRALQSGEMFGSWDDVARSAGMSQDDAIDIIQRLKSGGQVNNVERRLARDMIAHIRGNYDNPEIQNSPVRRAFQAEYTGPQGDVAAPAMRDMRTMRTREIIEAQKALTEAGVDTRNLSAIEILEIFNNLGSYR